MGGGGRGGGGGGVFKLNTGSIRNVHIFHMCPKHVILSLIYYCIMPLSAPMNCIFSHA